MKLSRIMTGALVALSLSAIAAGCMLDAGEPVPAPEMDPAAFDTPAGPCFSDCWNACQHAASVSQNPNPQACTKQCVSVNCPHKKSACGESFCAPQQTCCSGQPFPTPTCIDGDICPISRREHKTDIAYLGAAERERLHDELMSFQLATYRYKPGVADEAEHLGFIIDDVAPSRAVAPSGQRVDLYGYTTMTVAALQTQAQQIARLERELAELRAQLGAKGHAAPKARK